MSVKFLLSPLSKSNASLLNSPVRLERMARKARWLKRQARKLSPNKFVSGILLAVSQSEASLRLLASAIGLHSDHTISKQALWERIGPEAVEFFKGVLASLLASQKDKKLLFTPRHDFFSLDAGALKENCFCPILGLAYSEIRPLCARLALVSGKRPALVQSSSRST